MSSLFHRRTRSASAQRPKTPVSSSAHMAATQAFLANRASQSNLSASAAATALRTMSPPPVPVSDVQTKRMQRRSSSASLANAPRGRGRGTLERRDSSGSMTERTFRRSPSPGNPASQAAPEQAPPVPKLPPNVNKPPPIPAKSQRRTASLEAPPARVASPTMNRTGGRGQSAQPAPARSPQTNAAALVMRQHRPAELERSESRNSINFSYPRPMSPPARSPTSPEPQSPVSRNGISAAEAERVQYGVTQVAQQPVKKKKKKVAPQTAEGSHLSTGSMGSKPLTTPLEPGPAPPPQTQEQPVKKKKKKPAVATGQTSHFPPSPASTQESDSDSTPEKARRQQRASGILNKQPSVVREDWEGEQEQEQSATVGRRDQEGLSPIYETSKTVQGKKPMPAANMSRKIEEPSSPTPAEPNYTSAHHAVTEPQPSQPVQNKLLFVEESQHQRVSSLSPSRSTRFSDRLASDLTSGQKHSPLPRSVSPAKSAMKHQSPSGGSPVDPTIPRLRGSSATPSDASDSNISADGSVRRRKSARVSFQPEVEVAGTAAEPVDTDSPTLFSPQHKEQGRKGMFGRSKPALTTIPSQEEIDGHMRPRPQLPFFGSIRGKTSRTDSSDSVETPKAERKAQLLPPANIASSTSTSSDASSSSFQAGDQGVSSDHAIGSIFTQDAQRNAQANVRDTNLPLPPQVTSVEGSGDVSDTASDTTVEDHQFSAPAIANHHVDQTKHLNPSTAGPIPSSSGSAETKGVPELALQPPTPGTEQENPADQWAIEVPGGFPASTEELPSTATANGGAKPAGLGIGEPPFTPIEVSKQSGAQAISDSDVEASDHDSIYSDAAEDLSDLEGDGFGSIDAVVESPVVESPRARVTSTPSSPLAERPQGGNRTTSWEEAQQRWSGIAQQSREATVVQPPQPAQAVPTLSGPGAPSQPKKKKKKSAAAIAASSAPVISKDPLLDSPPKAKNQPSPYPIIDTTNHAPSSMRQSMRGPPPRTQNEPPAFRQSLRSQPAGQPDRGFRQSMRAQPAPAAPMTKARPQSMPQPPPSPPTQQRAALQKKHIPPAAAPPKPMPAKQAVQPFSNDSDSESSFKKSRRAKSSAGAFTMRTSMRAGPSDAPSQPAGRGIVRSLSPPQRRPFSPPPEQKAFRSSMRTPMDTAAPTLRGPPEQKRSSSLFGRKTKSPVRAQPAATKPAVRSRIAEDSDDDNEPRKQTFRSRIIDSSDDEDDNVGFRPVRGIPRRGDDGDSTDLDDSSDDEAKQKKVQPPPKINTAVAAASTSPAPLSPNTMKKKGLFSRFRSKKDKDDSSKSRLGVGTIGERNGTLEKSAPATKAAKNEDEDEEQAEEGGFENMGFGSAAERDAMIAQTMARLEAAKAEASPEPQPQPQSQSQPKPQLQSQASGSVSGSVPGSPAPASPSAGRLQRRITPQRFASDSWPLPPKIGALDEEQRPSTADAVGTSNGSPLRPGIGDRVPTSETLKTEGGTPILGRSGKKKRFPLLRKAFGLKD